MEKAVNHAYEESSQKIRWTYTSQSLQDRRNEVNRKAREAIAKNIDEEQRLRHEDQHANGSEAEDKSSDSVQFLDATEEQQIVVYFAKLVDDLAEKFRLPSHIRSTAVVFFKRFYMVLSVMQRRPKPVLLTCLYLATKTNDHYVALDKYCDEMKISQEEILSLEFIVCQAIRWDLFVWLPYKPLHGFILDMENALGSQSNPKELESLHGKARNVVSRIMAFDLIFIKSPSIIALAAMWRTNQALCSQYLERCTSISDSETNAALIDLIRSTAKEVDTCLATKSIPESRAVELGKKLSGCADPLRDKHSLMAKKRAADFELMEASMKKERKRAKKSSDDAVPSNPLA